MKPKSKTRELDMNTTDSFEIPNCKVLLDQATINAWLERTGDTNPIHRNKDFAIQHGFIDIVVPGAFIESIFIGMIDRCKTDDQMISSIEISHKKVTYINESLSFMADLKTNDQEGHIIEIKALNGNGDSIATGNIRIKHK
ncbi:MAG: MaoC family dehydratase [Dehalococcoidales bacterium]|nr:MaoC family dehydratase [Dehalococcoidales bacterium]